MPSISPQGVVLRAVITEALSKGGETFEDLLELIQDDKRVTDATDTVHASIRATLGQMAKNDLVEKRKGTWYLIPQHEPVKPPNGTGPRPSGVLASGSSARVELPAYQQKRAGVCITFESTPALIENVFSVEFKIGTNWIPVPLFTNTRFCVGPERPRWASNQTTYAGVSSIKVTLKTGEQNDYPHDANIPVTIAELEI